MLRGELFRRFPLKSSLAFRRRHRVSVQGKEGDAKICDLD